ncbi:MAG: P-II family nitrogen regulator [Candidatus Omnitrophica bacterium]|nr:P-II family nitrogen regulator [Candidatus Omnitrophota bacterium]
MKKIECIIRPERLEQLKKQFLEQGIGGMTISNVRGYGIKKTRPDNYLVLPKVKVEVYCESEKLDEIIETIITVCRRNELGDGKIAIFDIQDLIRIRTGERRESAIA